MTSLLGIADVQISIKHEISWQTNKIGGKPNWLPLHIRIPSCPGCDNQMSLIVQLYCPLENSLYHRTLYVFGCISPSCWNIPDSWIIYRCQSLDQQSQSSAPIRQTSDNCRVTTDASGTDADDWGVDADDWGVDADDWGVDADDWGTEDWGADGQMIKDDAPTVKGPDFPVSSLHQHRGDDLDLPADDLDLPANVLDLPLHQLCLDDVNDEETDNIRMQECSHVFVEDLPEITGENRSEVLQSIQTKTCVTDHTDNVLTSYFINVIEEPMKECEDDSHVTKLLLDYQRREGCNVKEMDASSSSGGAAEKYEKTSLKHKDKMFHKFLKRRAVCPEQCIRYHWNGCPLYICPPPVDVPNRCQHCHSDLVFELQLMPTLVNYLKLPDQPHPAIEFGSVLIFSCKQSCWNDDDTYRTEGVLVQPDPDQHLFK